jgi:hypothetical protein
MEHVIQACERVRQDGSIMGPFLFSNKDGTMNKKYTSRRRHAAELERIQRSESSSSHEGPLEFFHDTFGNQGVGKLVDHLQLKNIFPSGSDLYEQEADRLAARMVDPSSDNLQLKSVSSPSPSVDHSALVNDKIQQFKSGGAALDLGTRSYFEGKMGVDLSQVRVHKDQSTARFAQSINARAFTLGNHIGFGSGQFNPQSRQGKELLAHELVHTQQQRGSQKKIIQRQVANPALEQRLAEIRSNSSPRGTQMRPYRPEPEPLDIPQHTVKGHMLYWGTYKGGQRYHYREVITAPTSTWEQILSKGYDQQYFDSYVKPFLIAALGSNYSTSGWRYSSGASGQAFYPLGSITDQDRLNFLKALYGYRQNYQQEEDSGVVFDGNIFTGWTSEMQLNLVAQFVGSYQNLLVSDKSAFDPDPIFDKSNIDHFAEQAGTSTIIAMVSSATASAIAGVYVWLDGFKQGGANPQLEKGEHMIRNSAKIIEWGINAKRQLDKAERDKYMSIVETAISLIPLGKLAEKIVAVPLRYTVESTIQQAAKKFVEDQLSDLFKSTCKHLGGAIVKSYQDGKGTRFSKAAIVKGFEMELRAMRKSGLFPEQSVSAGQVLDGGFNRLRGFFENHISPAN